MKRINRRWTGW